MGKRRRTRVPEVLWRLYKDKASTLEETIVSLIPKHCDCLARRKCLRCVFGNDDVAAISYLIRPNDPMDYQKLMKGCFVVIPPDAPPLPPLIPFTRRWSQLQIVQRTIETFFSKQVAPSNVMCSGYKKDKKFEMLSSITKLLISSAWDLTLKRIGDIIMAYLLMHTLIFVPVRRYAHQQVAGSPVTGLFSKSFMHIPRPDSEISIDARHKRKRRRVGRKETKSEELLNIPFKSAKLSTDDVSCGEDAHEQPSKNLNVNLGKRLRLPSWQRRKRRKNLTPVDASSQEPTTKILNDEDDLHKTHHHDLINNQIKSDVMHTSVKTIDKQGIADPKSKQLMPWLCPCCSVLLSLSGVPKGAQINRKSMFYNLDSSSSLFLKKHVIYSLKPGFAGAKDLLRHILGLSSADARCQPASCFHSTGFCSNGSPRFPCLYHSLVKLLKVVLHRTKRCQFKRLLEKHCFIHSVSQFADGDACSTLQSNKMEAEVASFKQNVNQVNQPLKRSFSTELGDCKGTSEVIQHQFGLRQPYCLKDQVVSFVWAVCLNIVPPDMLGGPSNQRILRRNISRFVKLRRFEKFSLKQCMHKLKISKFSLLSNKQFCKHFTSGTKQIIDLTPQNLQNIDYSASKQTLLECWIIWLFAHIVLPLLEANFYITESENGKQNIYYFRKSVWEKLSDRVTTVLKDQNYSSLNDASLRKILNKRSFGFSRIRLCPKETGARPIANLKASSRIRIRGFGSHAQLSGKQRKGQPRRRIGKFSYLKSVNSVLRDLHVVLKDVRMNEPEKWGSSVFGYNDIYRKLCPFLRNLKEGQADMPSVFIVVSDVQKAFDTVNQDKLLTILDEVQMADEYTLQKSSEIFCRKKSMGVSENLKMITQGDGTRFAALTRSARWKPCHTVLLNQEQSKTVKKEELKSILTEHLKHNVLKLGQRFFLQIVGIPQGSVLSSLLCSLYYGHLERNIIYPLIAKKAADDMLDRDDDGSGTLEAKKGASFSSPKYLLLRFVDDFLFISTSKKQAAIFLSRFQRGFREYNCYMNQEKLGTNLDIGCKPGFDSKRFLVKGDDASFLRWSGLLINSSSLEVQADYTRYLSDHLSSTLTVSWEDRPGHQLKAKLCAYMRPKCHPIFFDTTINSPATIRLNVYQAFLLCAMKFHSYVRELSSGSKLHPRSYFTSIRKSIRYMYNLMKRRMYKYSRGSDCKIMLQVARKEVTWLGLTAYIRVLKRKQSRHKDLLRLLRAALVSFPGVGCSSELKFAVDDSNSSALWKIKY